jgi:TonB family protein
MKRALAFRLGRSIAATVLGVCSLVASAAAQEPLTKAKALYDAAAYEDALTVLAQVDLPEAQQYRALCLLALGRSQDAAAVVESLVSGQPMFEASSQDAPPRFVALVTETKRKLLPQLARKAFSEGRDQFRSGSREDALKRFALVMTLTADPSFKQSAEAEDLRTLASGFIDLAKAATPPPPAPTPATAPAPAPATAAKAATPSPAAAAAATSTEKPRASTEAPDIVQPVVVKQFIPPVPPAIGNQGGPSVSIRVLISPSGRVTDASIQQSAHPLYDRLVLQASRDWVYEPATMNGRPVMAEKVVTIQLR